jgi:flavoprotein hydroxylase
MRPASVWRRLDRPEGATPDEYELIRVASYKFQSLYAERWRVGRVFLAGDAAHQMPPFLAQGLCSGFRDSYNLAWKLDLVLKGITTPDFLDTYMAERGPNARATIVESMRVGQHVNERDPEKVRKRDAELMSLQAAKDKAKRDQKPQLIGFRVPGFSAGFISRSRASGLCGAGDAFIQGKVRYREHEGHFDDVVGRGFMIVSRQHASAVPLTSDDREFWRSVGGSIVRVSSGSAGEATSDVVDLESRYWQLMDEYDCEVIVKRPDNYIFGTCRSIEDLPATIADMREQLHTAE